MVAIQTQNLTGPALDWAVAKCEGYAPVFSRHYVTPSHAEDPKKVCIPAQSWVQPFEPSINWAQGGPIIERENISVGCQGHLGVPLDSLWYATNRADACGFGQTPLVAAMRCFCCSKLGDVVDIPEELCQQQNS